MPIISRKKELYLIITFYVEICTKIVTHIQHFILCKVILCKINASNRHFSIVIRFPKYLAVILCCLLCPPCCVLSTQPISCYPRDVCSVGWFCAHADCWDWPIHLAVDNTMNRIVIYCAPKQCKSLLNIYKTILDLAWCIVRFWHCMMWNSRMKKVHKSDYLIISVKEIHCNSGENRLYV